MASQSTSAVQDEYNSLFRSSAPSGRPDDASDSDGSTTLVSSPLHSSAAHSTYTKSLKASRYAADGDSSDEETVTTPFSPAPYYLPADYNSSANTGPKGVIADAQAFEAQKRIGRSARTNESYHRTRDMVIPRGQRAIRSPSRKVTRSTDDDGDEDDEDEEQLKSNSRHQSDDEKDISPATHDDADDSDDAAIAAWRAKRMAEMKSSRQQQQQQHNSHISSCSPLFPLRTRPSDIGRPSRKMGLQTPLRYHGLERVDEMGYLAAIESASRSSIVCVYIFDDDNEKSDAYAEILATVMEKSKDEGTGAENVRVVALHFELAEMEAAGMPALLAYRGGELFKVIVPLSEDVPMTRNLLTDLESCLRGNGIL